MARILATEGGYTLQETGFRDEFIMFRESLAQKISDSAKEKSINLFKKYLTESCDNGPPEITEEDFSYEKSYDGKCLIINIQNDEKGKFLRELRKKIKK